MLGDSGSEAAADFAASIAELQAALVGTDSINGFLQALATLAARELGQGLACGITLQPDGRPVTVASSDASADQIDELQYKLDHGPCLTALRAGEQISIDDLASDTRWGDYAVRALARGLRSSLSIPLTVQDHSVGALNLYSDKPYFFGEDQTRRAEQFGRDASTAVGIAARMAGQAALTDQLRAALASRGVINQALGIIMGQQRCTSAEAFDIMRAASQNRNIKLRQIAEQVVIGITGHPPEEPPFHDPR
jgi:GAF domain-containing protein